ncbi:MAG TPA: 16S rRNA (cytidine(1402)-2'-O)-methyltransferase [Myxococcales bacterium]|jgi:16S rRNA (cytidine1402-2'-O)-methyltransferase
MPGTLFLVATPLGNLGDITYRAVETLSAATAIVAEDTRRARILCERYGIERPLVSMPAFRELDQADALVARLSKGDTLALITDAGSPGISDPGTALVGKAIAAGIQVVPIPGPSAAVSALSASGLATDRFFFAGFLPRKGTGRERALSLLKRLDATLVLYESPERLRETLDDLREAFGDRRAVVARELTKIHEEFARGTLSDLAQRFAGEVRGEITLIVEGASSDASEAATDEAILAEVERRLAAGEGSVKEIAGEIAKATGRPRREVYDLALKAKGRK